MLLTIFTDILIFLAILFLQRIHVSNLVKHHLHALVPPSLALEAGVLPYTPLSGIFGGADDSVKEFPGL